MPKGPFVEVTEADIPEIRHPPGTASALAVELEKGKRLFLEGETTKSLSTLRAREGYLRRRGYKVHLRTGEYKGKTGVFVWASRKEENA